MICPTSIDSTPQTAPATFTNWAHALTFTAARSFHPSTRGEIVEIIRQAEQTGEQVKWAGSIWSFMGNYECTDLIIESDGITGEIDRSVILDHLPLVDDAIRGNLLHIKGGTKVFNVNRILQGLPPAPTGDQPDEYPLECTTGGRGLALPTLGGSGGQSIAGVMATGSHGGDIALPPIADAVMAIHLIGPGGQEFWIERSTGFTAGNEATVQSQLQTIASTVPGAGVEMCNGVLVKKDDDFFRAVLVSVGRMGFVFSLVIKAVSAFKLEETRTRPTWEAFKSNLSLTNFPAFSATFYFMQVIINPFGNGTHECTVASRSVVDCSTKNNGVEPPGLDFTSFICRQQDVRVFIPVLLAALAVLIGIVAGLTVLAQAEFAAATALSAIPFVGWILAAALFAIWLVTVAAIIALGAAIAALTALIAYLTFSGSLTSGELLAAISNFAYTFGLKSLMKTVLTMLFDSLYPLTPSSGTSWVGVSWKIMDTYNYTAEDFCQKVDSMEIAFDAFATGRESLGGYLAFIDDVFAIFDDLYNRNIGVAGIMSLRYTSKTTALIGMSKFPTTCHIEIPLLRNFAGNAEFIMRVQQSAIAHGGVPHWGQLMGTYTGTDIVNLHGGDLTTWRTVLAQLINLGNGSNPTFSNNFTVTYNLEPFGLPDNCAAGGPFPTTNLGAFNGPGTSVQSMNGDATVDNVTNSFNLQLTSQHGSITVNQKIDQHSIAVFTACQEVSIGQKIDQHSQATILAHGDVTIGQMIDEWSTGDITSTKGAINIGQTINQHSNATLNAATTVSIAQKIDQHSVVTIVAQGDIAIGQAIDQHSSADITSLNGNITIGQAVDGNAQATLRAPNGNIRILQKVAGGASVQWSALSFTCPDTSGGTVTKI